MTRWILRLLSRREVGALVRKARSKNAYAVRYAAQGWHGSADALMGQRDLLMWEARELAMRPRKPALTFRGIPVYYNRRMR